MGVGRGETGPFGVRTNPLTWDLTNQSDHHKYHFEFLPPSLRTTFHLIQFGVDYGGTLPQFHLLCIHYDTQAPSPQQRLRKVRPHLTSAA